MYELCEHEVSAMLASFPKPGNEAQGIIVKVSVHQLSYQECGCHWIHVQRIVEPTCDGSLFSKYGG